VPNACGLFFAPAGIGANIFLIATVTDNPLSMSGLTHCAAHLRKHAPVHLDVDATGALTIDGRGHENVSKTWMPTTCCCKQVARDTSSIIWARTFTGKSRRAASAPQTLIQHKLCSSGLLRLPEHLKSSKGSPFRNHRQSAWQNC
jgi:hypothetical protein